LKWKAKKICVALGLAWRALLEFVQPVGGLFIGLVVNLDDIAIVIRVHWL